MHTRIELYFPRPSPLGWNTESRFNVGLPCCHSDQLFDINFIILTIYFSACFDGPPYKCHQMFRVNGEGSVVWCIRQKRCCRFRFQQKTRVISLLCRKMCAQRATRLPMVVPRQYSLSSLAVHTISRAT